MKPSLIGLCQKYKKGDWPDKASTHSYIEVYQKMLASYRDTAKNILEIGLMSGESLRMWDEYFAGDVYGIDCDIRPIGGLADLSIAISQGYKIYIGDAENPMDIYKYFKGVKFDVVIEDASHHLEQQLKIYNVLKPYMNEGSIYIIEDIQDIEASRLAFENIDHEKHIQILDRRGVKQRYDDVLVIIKDKI